MRGRNNRKNEVDIKLGIKCMGDVKDPKVGISTWLIEQGVKGVLEEFLQKKHNK